MMITNFTNKIRGVIVHLQINIFFYEIQSYYPVIVRKILTQVFLIFFKKVKKDMIRKFSTDRYVKGNKIMANSGSGPIYTSK